MNSTKYSTDVAIGKVPIEKIIDKKYLEKAKEYAALMQDLSLTGNVTEDSRTAEEVAKDEKAIQLLKTLAECKDPALAYGFMLYNETGIVKLYWTKRVGKLRKDKREFFELDKYFEWLTEIFATLNGDHPKFHDPLYYYRFKSRSRKGAKAGVYDIMNSFRTHWNMYFLSILGIYLNEEDKKLLGRDSDISIESTLENENGAGNYLEAAMAKQYTTKSLEQTMEYRDVEGFLKEFNKFPLREPIAFKAGTRATGITYRDVVKALVDGSIKNPTALRTKFAIGLSIQEKVMSKIKKIMNRFDIDIQTFSDYINEYRDVALEILNGHEEATFSQYLA